MRKLVGKQHIIELNGKRYDALTGKMITNASATQLPPHNPKVNTQKSMDGVARPPRSASKTAPQPHRHIEKSHTLMRKTVHKPIHNKLHAVATIIDKEPATNPTVAVQRQSAQKQVSKSSLIRRFSQTSVSTPSPQQDDSSHTSRPFSAVNVAQPVLATQVRVNPLNQAIANATSHQQPKLKRPQLHHRAANRLHVSPRVISVGVGSLVALLIFGFIGYQNIPNVKMRLASSRAGLHGSLPAYQPPGFRLSDISYQAGQINVNFRSNSDSRNFIVTQAASSWNSDTLREKLKALGQLATPVEVPDKGKTLFIYDSSNITWVDGGVLYKIEGDSKLSSEQLLHLANSL